MMKTSTATILFLRVHISSIRQIGLYYKAMILELYILHAVGRVCMAICQSEGAGNKHTQGKVSCMIMHVSCMMFHGMHGATFKVLKAMHDHAWIMHANLEWNNFIGLINYV